MVIKEVFIQAVQSLISHRTRALMTMTGISWGIVAVVMLMAYGNGFHTALMVGFKRAFSTGTVVIWNGQTSMQAGGERAGKKYASGRRHGAAQTTRRHQVCQS
ncbi:MAG: ABC transporter permease [Acidobacteria bacterium]|nr:ABC transporter permease [Acidobacteriota bacterium]